MKEKIKTFFCVLFLAGALPYIITMVIQGKNTGREEEALSLQPEDIKTGEEIDVEKYLLGIVAKEIPISYETEVLKAQAVIARTNLLAAMENQEEIPEGLNQEELMKLWGRDGFEQNYERLAKAVQDTAGKALGYQGGYIYAAYHAVSNGSTRNGQEALDSENVPYLAAADSSMDVPAEEFLKVVFLEPESLLKKLQTAFPEAQLSEENLLGQIEIVKRDSVDYVTELTLGGKSVSGEAFREALGLNSACFYLEEVEGKIRIVTKGLGHGLGMSQYGANEMAKEGADWQEILNYYFKNVEILD